MALKSVLDILDKQKLKYCILHGWQFLPDHLPSDLDIAVNLKDLDTLEKTLFRHKNGRLVQLLQHESSCFYFVIASGEEDAIQFTFM